MAQGHINYANGEDVGDMDVAADATGSIESLRLIVAASVTRDEAAEGLERIRTAILDGRLAWPLA